MRKVGIKVLKDELSKYVRLAEAGETVEVTDRGKVVAQLGPPSVDRSKMTPEERWADWVRRGIVTPAKYPIGYVPPRKPMISLEQLLKELDEDREDRV